MFVVSTFRCWINVEMALFKSYVPARSVVFTYTDNPCAWVKRPYICICYMLFSLNRGCLNVINASLNALHLMLIQKVWFIMSQFNFKHHGRSVSQTTEHYIDKCAWTIRDNMYLLRKCQTKSKENSKIETTDSHQCLDKEACFHKQRFLFGPQNTITIAYHLSSKAKKSWNVRDRTFSHVRPAKIQISLRIRAVWSESSLGAFWVAKGAKFLHADNNVSDQTAPVRRLICVFVGCAY